MHSMTIGGSVPYGSNERTRGLISAYIIAAASSIALGVAYFPIDPPSFKFGILIGLTALISVLDVVHVKRAFASSGLKWLCALTIVFLIICYVHGYYNPPASEYAESKLRNLAFSMIFFQVIIIIPFINKEKSIFLIYALFAFSFVFCIMNLMPSNMSSNLRYSAIGLSPTMVAKIVLIVAVFSLTMRRDTLFGKLILFALLILSVWSSVRTGSRGPVIMLALSYGVFLYLKGGLAGFAKWTVYLPLILVVVVVALQFMPDEIAGRFDLSKLSFESNSDKGDRVYLWNLALLGLQDSWTGYGLGNYSVATFLAAPHNIILEAAYELGIAIALLYCIVVLVPLVFLKKLARTGSEITDFFIVLYLMMLLLSLISGEMTLTSALMYVSGGFIWGIAFDSRRHRSSR